MMQNDSIKKIMTKNPQLWTVTSILDHSFGNILLFDDHRACIKVSNFYYIEGPFLEAFGAKIIKKMIAPNVIISSNNDWYNYFIKKVNAELVQRYLYHWSGKPKRLNEYLVKSLEQNYVIKPINIELALQIQTLDWADGIFDSYTDIKGFLDRGFGFCIIVQNKIVSLCLSFAHSEYGVEIEVDTDPDYQGKGLGKIVSAYFVAEALRRGITPLWDATNLASIKVAEALGFNLLYEYTALAVY